MNAAVARKEKNIRTRTAMRGDAAAIARIYNQGIEDRVATFETKTRSERDIAKWFDTGRTSVVVEVDGDVLAYASAFIYRERECYSGVREFSVYVDRAARGLGLGRVAMVALMEAAKARGDWKLLSRVFPENEASLKLLASLGFREVGTYKNHAKLDGVWRDVVIVEKLIGEDAP
jgi:L-amino acid N-acyltransferase YncA